MSNNANICLQMFMAILKLSKTMTILINPWFNGLNKTYLFLPIPTENQQSKVTLCNFVNHNSK
jgi:hypothetical protein